MIFTPEERRAILAVGGLLLFGQGLGAWQSWQQSRPDRELNHWLVEWTAAKAAAEVEAEAEAEPSSTVAWSPPPVQIEPIDSVPPGWIDSGKILVNEASAEQLQQLPGIGPALAGRIVETRAEAPFLKLDDLIRVPGIGARTLERLRPFLILEP